VLDTRSGAVLYSEVVGTGTTALALDTRRGYVFVANSGRRREDVDPCVLLKIDIELDGWHHRQADRAERDEVRNQSLQRRGWYVYRIPGGVIARRQEECAIAALMVVVRNHHHAVTIARSSAAWLGQPL
jgi:hypothetical protein